MKQDVLAKGICSVSHLSRIENGKIEPSEEILEMLSNRLGLSLSEKFTIERVNVEEFEELCIKIINLRDQEAAARLIKELTRKFTSVDMQTKTGLELLVIRLRLVIKGQKKEALEELAKYQEIISTLNPKQSFTVLQMKGMAFYANGELKSCLEAFAEAASMMESLSLSPFERADFTYVRSVAFMVDGQKFEALVHAKQALPYFQSIMAGQRVVECHLIIGIAYKNSGQLTKSLEVFHLVEQICKQFALDSFLGMLHQNIGGVYSVIGESEHAISHFKQAIDHKELPSELMYSIYSLVKEYEKKGKMDIVMQWLNKGTSMLPKLHERKREYYEPHFNAYEALCSKDEEKIEDELLKAFRYFKKRGSQKQWMEYANRLAELYVGNGKYKKAVYYYKMIIDGKGGMK